MIDEVHLMTMKHSMDKTITNIILETSKAKEFMEFVGKKFKKFDKIEKSYYLNLLTRDRYDGASGVGEAYYEAKQLAQQN